jgi:hypothetical protein
MISYEVNVGVITSQRQDVHWCAFPPVVHCSSPKFTSLRGSSRRLMMRSRSLARTCQSMVRRICCRQIKATSLIRRPPQPFLQITKSLATIRPCSSHAAAMQPRLLTAVSPSSGEARGTHPSAAYVWFSCPEHNHDSTIHSFG